MPSNNRMVFHLRLEDIVALTFFLLTMTMRIFIQGFGSRQFSPADVLVIIPAMTILFAKEFVHYFLMGSRQIRESTSRDLKSFVRPYWEILRDWSPFLVILLMYYSLWGEATHLLVTRDMDRELIEWDHRLFGMQASVALEPWVSPPLTAWMKFAYFFHIVNIPLVACFIYVWRTRQRFREMMTGIVAVTFLGLIGYLLVPAVGPMYTLRDQYTIPLTVPLDVVNRQIEFMDFARIKRDVFPSLHVGISFVAWLYAFRNSRKLFWILSPLVLSLFISTVYLRYHYLVDVVAGLLLAPCSFLLANWLFKRWGEVQLSLALPRAWTARAGGDKKNEIATKAGGQS